MIRRPPRSTQSRSSAASDVYKRQNTDKVVQALVDKLPDLNWSRQFGMFYVPNTKINLELIFKTFKGVAWVNGNYFFTERLINIDNPKPSVEHYRNRKIKDGYKPCPEEYLLKLELKRY